MIRILARMTVREDAEAAFMTMGKELVEKSRQEKGNLSYSLNRSLDDPTVFVFVEVWADQAAQDSHNATEHFTTILPKLVELTTQCGPVELYAEI